MHLRGCVISGGILLCLNMVLNSSLVHLSYLRNLLGLLEILSGCIISSCSVLRRYSLAEETTKPFSPPLNCKSLHPNQPLHLSLRRYSDG